MLYTQQVNKYNFVFCSNNFRTTSTIFVLFYRSFLHFSSAMSTPILSTEARRFCQTTSLRGIPRIVNSKSTIHCIIWLLGVLTCTGVLVWQVAIIFKRYRSYPTNTISLQSPEWDNTTFPDITICNLCSLVHET